MKFNPTKCVHFTISNKRDISNYNYSIYNQPLYNKFHLPSIWKSLLTVILTGKINTAKAFQQRNIYQCPKAIKSNCYKSVVRLILEYAAPVWSPFLHCQIYQIKIIQCSMARFVMNDHSRYSSVTNKTNHLNWPTLAARQNLLKLILFSKIEKKFIDTDLNLISLDTVTWGHPCRFFISSIRTESYANSFLPSTTKLWNELPESLVLIDNVNDLKHQITHIMS